MWLGVTWNAVPAEIPIRLILAFVLSGTIGLEREYRQKTAGFRTHLLVGLGSALFTLLSIDGFPGGDPARVAAQVVSGIGFVGAGAILRQGLSVRGLTTASTLWVVAAIGMAVAIGWYEAAVLATGLALLALILLANFETLLPAWPTPVTVQLRLGLNPDLAGVIRDLIGEGAWAVQRGQREKINDRKIRLTFLITKRAGTDQDVQELISQLETLPGLEELGWELVESTS